MINHHYLLFNKGVIDNNEKLFLLRRQNYYFKNKII